MKKNTKKKPSKKFNLPKVSVWNKAFFDGEGRDEVSPELRKISDPVMRLAVTLKEEAESCGERYDGMEDCDWYDMGKSYVSIVTGKVRED